MSPTVIPNEEQLYRSLSLALNDFKIVDGSLKVSSTAFNDRKWKPSVDRASLRASPEEARKSPTDGIVQLLTEDVRSISGIKINPNNKNSEECHAVDVIHRPVDDPVNIAHSQIECDPEFASESRFRKLKEALAVLASTQGFILEPASGEGTATHGVSS